MLATEFFFSQTFYSRAPSKNTKSQQESTYTEYEKIQVFFPIIFPVYAMFLCKLAVLQVCFTAKNSFSVALDWQ